MATGNVTQKTVSRPLKRNKDKPGSDLYRLQYVDVYVGNQKIHIPPHVNPNARKPPFSAEPVLTTAPANGDTLNVGSQYDDAEFRAIRRKYSREGRSQGLKAPDTAPPSGHDDKTASERIRKRTYTKVGGSIVNAQGGLIPIVTMDPPGHSDDGSNKAPSATQLINQNLPPKLLTRFQDYYDSDSDTPRGSGSHWDLQAFSQQKRTTRASVLTRAEKLLMARRNSYSDDEVDYSTDRTDLLRSKQSHYRSKVPLKRIHEQNSSDESPLESGRTDVTQDTTVTPQLPVVAFTGKRHRNAQPSQFSDEDLDDDRSDGDGYVSSNVGGVTYLQQSFARDRLPPDDSQYQDTNKLETDRMEAAAARKKGRIVTFYRNGDPHFKGKTVLVSQKTFKNLETLLVHLSSIIPTSTGVRYVFSWPDGREIKSVTELEHQRLYVASTVRKLNKEIKYGQSSELFWKGGKLDRNDFDLFKIEDQIPEGSQNTKRPRVITVISNMQRRSRQKLIINPQTRQNFEDTLQDLNSMIYIPHPPVQALYTERQPFSKVEGFAQLLRDFKDHDTFLACGTEMVPLEMLKKRGIPSSNSSNDSVDSRPRRRKVHSGPGQSGPNGLSPVFRRARGGASSITPATNNNRQYHRKWRDVVRVDILGKQREFYAPSQIDVDDDGAKPDKKLRLDWAYGFRGRDPKSTLLVVNSGELVYNIAAIVVLYDKSRDSQRHYIGHTEEVTCLALHPNGDYVASGQLDGKSPEGGAHIRVWDVSNLATHHVIGLGVLQGGVNSISFATESDGDMLMAIDDSDKHSLTVWDVLQEKLLAKTTTTTDAVTYGCFYPFDDTILITFGKQHLYFWKMFWNQNKDLEGKLLRDKKSGIFQEDIPKHITSICFSSTGDVLTGDSSGSILIWSRYEDNVFAVNTNFKDAMEEMKFAHKKSVSSLYFLHDGTLLSGGGNVIKAWDSMNKFKKVKERMIPDTAGNIRMIVPQKEGGFDGRLYVGTTGGCILEGTLQLKFRFLVQGHSDEVWGVANHPHEPSFTTAGYDQYVIKWSTVAHAVVWRVHVERPCTSVSIDPKGRIVALGTTSGHVIVINSFNGMHLSTVYVGNSQINTLAFSPDGNNVAVGTDDGYLHLFEVDEDYRFFRTDSMSVRGTASVISQLDWSSDCRFLQTVQGDYEITYWDAENLQKMKTGRLMKDTDWYTLTCTVGYNLIGPWMNLQKKELLNVVCRSQFRDYVITGDNKGRLRLYKYPCSAPKAEYRGNKVYTNNITAAIFVGDDNFVVSAGGGDANLLQWAVIDPMTQR